MIEFKNIILTTDLSENALAAAPYAIHLAHQSHGTIYLVHVFEDSTFAADISGTELMGFDPQAMENSAVSEHQERLQNWKKRMPKHNGVSVVPVIVKGHAVVRILDVAKEKNADIIVIATHGRTGLAHFLSGSVAEKIVRLSPCPVMTVRPVVLAEK